jgi:hypothetical protein
MKKLMTIFALILSFTTLAQPIGNTQSYMALSDGNVAIIKSHYDSEKPYIINEQAFIMEGFVSELKSNYFTDQRGIISTVSHDGFIYDKFDYIIDSKIEHYGGTFFITRKKSLYIVRNDGLIYEYNEIEDFDKVRVLGGNFFMTRDDRLFTVTSNGTWAEMTKFFMHKRKDIEHLGHNFMIMEDGSIYTIGEKEMSELDSYGNKQYYNVVQKAGKIDPNSVNILGGNFFLDTDQNIHTVSSDGVYNRGVFNRRVKVRIGDRNFSNYEPVSVGTNYIVYPGNEIIMVANDGLFYYVGKLFQAVTLSNK